MDAPIQCSCGQIRGHINSGARFNRAICYCADCQAFARTLGKESETLNPAGGTEVIQTLPKNIQITQGAEHLACLRLTEKGLLRWYAACCNTPLANTPANMKMSFVGLTHNGLGSDQEFLNERFGPVQMVVNTANALSDPKPRGYGVAAATIKILSIMLKALLNGDYKQTPFFNADTGEPIASPRILSENELQQAMKAS